jgi:DNA-binding NarL/FixJ family response regulator
LWITFCDVPIDFVVYRTISQRDRSAWIKAAVPPMTALDRSGISTARFVEERPVTVSLEFLSAVVAEERWTELGRVVDDDFFALLLTNPEAVRAALEAAPDEWLMANVRYLNAREISSHGSTGAGLIDENISQRFRTWVAQTPSPATRDVLGVQQSDLRFFLAAGRFAEANAKADETLATIDNAPDPSGFLDVIPVVLIRAGIAKLFVADTSSAIACFADASRWASMRGRHPAWRHAENYLALALAIEGNYAQGRKHLNHDLDDARSAPDTLARQYEAGGILATAMVAIGALDRDRAAAAIDQLDPGITAGEFWWLASHARARFALYWGDRAAAIRDLEDTLVYRRSLAGHGSLAGLIARADLADLYQASNNLPAAHHVLDRSAVETNHVLLIPTRSRLDLLSGHFERAVARVDASALIAARHVHGAAARLAVKAAAEAAMGDANRAAETLAQVADSIRITGAVNLIAEALPEIRNELALLAGAESLPFPDVYPRAAHSPRLTPRERDVLEALRNHTTIKDIAIALHVSPNTAKTHLQSLYRKLSVHTREQALRRSHSAEYHSEIGPDPIAS